MYKKYYIFISYFFKDIITTFFFPPPRDIRDKLYIRGRAEKTQLMSYLLLLIFVQWHPSPATLIEDMYKTQGGLYWKINFIWSHSMRVS